MTRSVALTCETRPLKAPFSISGKTITHVELLIVTLKEMGRMGRGEAAGIFYLGETAATMRAQVQDVIQDVAAGATRAQLLHLLPRGGARNALDCALWDLEAKQQNQSVWQTAALSHKPVTTVMTIGIDTPDTMAKLATHYANYPILKIKLDGNDPLARLSAIRSARPDATLIVDANQGFEPVQLASLVGPFADLGLAMLEQPLPRGADAALDDLECFFPLCADESCLDLSELDTVARRYQMINIKLDKTGGLTHALALVEAARNKGLGLMVGNMHGTSLAMAPAFVIAQMCAYVDLDGPLLLASDRHPPLMYDGPDINWPAAPGFWGMPQ